jgi:hypothetical protein
VTLSCIVLSASTYCMLLLKSDSRSYKFLVTILLVDTVGVKELDPVSIYLALLPLSTDAPRMWQRAIQYLSLVGMS